MGAQMDAEVVLVLVRAIAQMTRERPRIRVDRQMLVILGLEQEGFCTKLALVHTGFPVDVAFCL